MSNTFDNPVPAREAESPEKEKKRKLWRNLFIFNLCISLLLMGLFWLPLKFVEINDFMGSSSVEPRRDTQAVTAAKEPEAPDNLMGSKYIVINATNEEKWTYFDFSRGSHVDIFDPTSREWDMAFRRGKIITNGGATNKFGKAGVLDAGEVEFESVDQVPDGEFVLDKATRTDHENPALAQWYKYNYITHKLTARKNIYIIRTADGNFAKVQFLGFYCANKEPGCIQMRYTLREDGSTSFLKPQQSVVSAEVASTTPVSDL